MKDHLKRVRTEIDTCDKQLIELIEKRLHLAEEVAKIKESKSKVALTDPKREKEMVQHLMAQTDHSVLRSEIPNLFSILMDMSKRVRVIKHQTEKNKFLPSLKLGIVGLGHFGTMLADTFRLHWPQSELYLYDIQDGTEETLRIVCESDLLFVCVPISQLESCLECIRPHLADNTTVIDVCTVKVFAVEIMKRILGDRRMIASHPMFGPQSTKNGTEFVGLNLVSCNVTAPAFIYDVFTLFWHNLGVQVIELTPEEHDQFAAYSINYNHLVGRIGERIGLRTTPIDTKGFRVVYDAMQYVTNDTWQLFRDMQVFNPFAEEMRKKVQKAILDIDNKLQE